MQNVGNRVILNIFFRSWGGLFRAAAFAVLKCGLNNFGGCFDFRGWTPYPDSSRRLGRQVDETVDEAVPGADTFRWRKLDCSRQGRSGETFWFGRRMNRVCRCGPPWLWCLRWRRWL